MPSEGVPLSPKEHLLTKSEIIRLAQIFVGQGITKIRLTGGEPTIRKDFMEIVGNSNSYRGIEPIETDGSAEIGNNDQWDSIEEETSQIEGIGPQSN
jgi:molybdenum cofactor biosynthesis enzyme MoaA